jgi:hypothetical protein
VCMIVLAQNLETFEEYMAARKVGSKSSASVVSMANGSVPGDKQSAAGSNGAGRPSCVKHAPCHIPVIV